MKNNIYELHANICKALANPFRIEIIEKLNDSELSFGDLMKVLDISKSNLSQHLSIMVSNGLVIQRKEGVNSYFQLSSVKVAAACQIMREVLVENLNDKVNLLVR
ncbi:MAG: metalloregulator ArsR/SmtB family transcription factor [Candidatus Kapabacteria bacterium]|jgi:ArsR family transcriptional regulator|nr:metalloregulator ArsR/SmtB family transcription factor [Candidatus Kapabacteria bacterium]